MITKIRYWSALAIVIAILLLFPGRRGNCSVETVLIPNVAREEVTIQFRQYPEDGHPWYHGAVIRVRLDLDRLRAYDLSVDDVMKAFAHSGVGPPRPVPPPGVVFFKCLPRPDQCENIILRANAKGQILRLKDVARVEAGR